MASALTVPLLYYRDTKNININNIIGYRLCQEDKE
jgi:hypothetical protein